MSLYERLRPFFFCLPPEMAHAAGLKLLAKAGGAARMQQRVANRWPRIEDPVELLGLRFPNRVGLAAGYDKDATAWMGLAALGFGHLELGTVTPRPQPGNPRPRVFRLSKDRGLINRLGFPSRGSVAMAARMPSSQERWELDPKGPVIGVNIGKQKETPLLDAADDYRALVCSFAGIADYLAVNISSPNTPELRRLQGSEFLGRLIQEIVEERNHQEASVGRRVPLLVKIAPDLEDDEIDTVVGTLVEAGVDGLIATNTTISREGLRSPHRVQMGGASGQPLTQRSLRVVERVAERLAGSVPLIGVGGIGSGDDAVQLLNAGASLVQLYTGLIYAGPSLVSQVAEASRCWFSRREEMVC